jgi:hypothetical protein
MDSSGPERVPSTGHSPSYIYNSASRVPRAMVAELQADPGQDRKNSYIDGNEENKNRSKIGGLPPRTFWLLIVLIALLVIGASIGGAIGGTRGSKSIPPASTITIPLPK